MQDTSDRAMLIRLLARSLVRDARTMNVRMSVQDAQRWVLDGWVEACTTDLENEVQKVQANDL